jgi:YD repeat-containing protein
VGSRTREINESVYAPCSQQNSLFSRTRSLFCAATIPVPNRLVAEQQRLKMPVVWPLSTFWTAAASAKSLLNSLLSGNWRGEWFVRDWLHRQRARILFTPGAYAYDGGGNPASATDPNNNTTTFGYSSFGNSSLLTQIFYPSKPAIPAVTNTYDSLGRANTQANAYSAVWNYFFAGYRSEEVDTYNTCHVLYFNPRGKDQFEIQDYGASPPSQADNQEPL